MNKKRFWKNSLKLGFVSFMMVGVMGLSQASVYAAPVAHPATQPGTVTAYTIPTPNSSPGGIAAGPDGNLWFTERAGNKIGRISPIGTITEFPLPTLNSGPTGIAAGPDGNLWFIEYRANKVGRITSGK